MTRGDAIKIESRKPGLLRTACKALDAVLRAYGYDDARLARLTGCALATLSHQRSMGFTSRRTRARIEAALGVPIWSKPADFAKRKRQKELLGIDPIFMSRTQLRTLAKAAQLPLWSDAPNRRTLVDRLSDHIEGHPHFRRTLSTSIPTPCHD